MEDRTQFIGGSDVAAILGFSPYRTRLQVWEEKVGLSHRFEANAHTTRGTKLEAIAANEYSEKYGVDLRRMNTRVRHPSYPFLTALIDRRVVGRRALVELKCPSLGMYSKMKRTGLGEDYICQMHHYLNLMDFDEGFWGVFCADQWDMMQVPVTRDETLERSMTERLVAFWQNHVLTKVAPDAESGDEERLEIRRAEGEVALYEMDGDPAFCRAAELLREARAILKDSELVAEEAKAQIKELMGERAGVYVGPGFRISLIAMNGRASFDAKALANAKPLDRLKVGALLQPLFDRAAPGSEFEGVVQAIGRDCGLDLTPFQKVGKPFTQLRPTFSGEDQ
ncbi:MAG TPA: YqaJ viral recombinase family protein [Candidatus Saccharimonadales bacterium]|jgi:putative phage-type endonuclease|nr:YqaJ viral recombinase family protein [Candidatus Saccharimonadales bacterium]